MMNLKKFLSKFQVTLDSGNAAVPASIKRRVDEEFLFVIEHLGGKTFNDGLYRVYRGDEIKKFTDIICEQFDAAQGECFAFAADWMGRQFIIDFAEMQDDKPTIGLLEPGVPDSCSSDQPIGAFHNEELVKGTLNMLAEPFYKEWKKKTKGVIGPNQCVGYEVPLFLGGEVKVKNLEVIDMEVYLHFCVKLWNKVKDLPDGTPIGDIIADEDEE
jgi:hypothetical protein